MAGTAVTKRYTGARDTTFARSARIVGLLSVTDTYTHHTYKLFPRCDAEFVASR